MAYPLMVRKRIIALYEEHKKTTAQIAEVFGISKSGTRRVRQRRRERGTLEPSPGRRGRKPKLTEEVERRIREHVAAAPDATRQEIKEALGLSVGLQSIGRWLRKLGLVLKKSRSAPPNRRDRTSRPAATPGTRS